ncbi:hypothetical protein PanWU01x14_221770 [Parasponia andersonii]|uniref:Uncharacterized protein n=1 Tax=Parasponia andersonii TaxID=3476 RepID=A0A2P5BPI1_PARAD|nr:hypothetical protein PanWU01x14_221770 [Parasponia andersonii]
MKVVIAQLRDHRTWINDFNCSNKRQLMQQNGRCMTKSMAKGKQKAHLCNILLQNTVSRKLTPSVAQKQHIWP